MYKIDHIVHFVDDPEDATKDLRKQGLHVVPGGRHEQWGTYNALCYFDTAYIELIGIHDKEKFKEAASIPYTLHQTHARGNYQNGLVRVAISTTTIDEDARSFRAAGFDVIGPDHFTRTRPDGSVIGWQLLHVGRKECQIELPFFIQWDQPEEERVEEMQELGIIQEHEVGPLQIAEVSYIVPNFETAEALVQLCMLESTLTRDEELRAEVLTVHTPTGNLAFYCPYDDGDAWDVLMEEGAGIYTLILAGASKERLLHYENASYLFTAERENTRL
ncbi:MAG: VOC family protein [Lysinibacillus sp.]